MKDFFGNVGGGWSAQRTQEEQTCTKKGPSQDSNKDL